MQIGNLFEPLLYFYLFQNEWTEVGKDNDDNTPSVPVKLDITIVDVKYYQILYKILQFKM